MSLTSVQAEDESIRGGDDRADEKRANKENKEGAMIKGDLGAQSPSTNTYVRSKKQALTPEG
jgi:hypothetical protein